MRKAKLYSKAMKSHTCQCCLAPGSTKDIFNKYLCNGEKEVYSEMLLNTFNITALQDTSSNKICEQCIIELRRAMEFKMKVIKSTNYLLTLKSLKIEDNNYNDDFDHKINVDFDENSSPHEYGSGRDKIFLIKMNPANYCHDTHDCGTDNIKCPLAEVKAEEITDDNHDVSLNENSKGRIEIEHQKGKRKPKQPESQNHKAIKQNSLNLVIYSNLCLFKSLKTKFGCFICTEAFLTMKELREHSKIHTNVELIRAKFNRWKGLSYKNADISFLKCTKCRQPCTDLTDLKKHLMERHDVEFRDAEHFLIPYKLEDSFDCVICNEKFNTYMRLSVHMNKHYSNNVCEICGNSYINRISLRIHLQTRHKEKKCSLCPETFITNYSRVRHMRTHHNSRMSKRYCLICGKTFRYTYQLTEHKILEHGVKREFSKCSLCPKTFPSTQNLKIHIRSVHIRERHFPCSVCDMRFFTKFDQKRHEITHLNARSFACELCESKFKGKDSLRRHLKRQHLK